MAKRKEKITSDIGWSTPDQISVRGLDLPNEILGHMNLGDLAFLQLTGRKATPEESRVFNAIVITLVEHGITPSALAARMTYMGAPESLQAAVAAGLCGVSESTLSRWIKQSDFQDVYTQARSELVQRSLSSLQTASIEALDALKRNLACGLPAIEVRAASALLDQSLRATELAGLEARLDALEDTVTAACTHE